MWVAGSVIDATLPSPSWVHDVRLPIGSSSLVVRPASS
jgi:hypothetical protein